MTIVHDLHNRYEDCIKGPSLIWALQPDEPHFSLLQWSQSGPRKYSKRNSLSRMIYVNIEHSLIFQPPLFLSFILLDNISECWILLTDQSFMPWDNGDEDSENIPLATQALCRVAVKILPTNDTRKLKNTKTFFSQTEPVKNSSRLSSLWTNEVLLSGMLNTTFNYRWTYTLISTVLSLTVSCDLASGQSLVLTYHLFYIATW